MEGMKRVFQGFSYVYLPHWMRESMKLNDLMTKEIYLTERKIGKEKTAELINQFANEAFAQKGVNSDYIIRKLKEARGNEKCI